MDLWMEKNVTTMPSLLRGRPRGREKKRQRPKPKLVPKLPGGSEQMTLRSLLGRWKTSCAVRFLLEGTESFVETDQE
jgi:hypothetical protein